MKTYKEFISLLEGRKFKNPIRFTQVVSSEDGETEKDLKNRITKLKKALKSYADVSVGKIIKLTRKGTDGKKEAEAELKRLKKMGIEFDIPPKPIQKNDSYMWKADFIVMPKDGVTKNDIYGIVNKIKSVQYF